MELAHRLRAEHDAVLVGIGTVLVDDPRLTVRLVSAPSPLRVVVDSRLQVPLGSQLLTDHAAPTIVATNESVSAEAVEKVTSTGATVSRFPSNGDGRVDLPALLKELDRLGVHSVLVEGGQAIITSCLRQALVDRLVICLAPKLVGAGIDGVGDLGIDELSRAVTFRESTFRPLGSDMIFDGLVNKTR